MTPTSGGTGDLWAGGAAAPVSNLSAVCWAAAANLLIFFCFAHLGVIVCFAAGWQIPGFLAPAALLCALGTGDRLARREGMKGRSRFAPLIAALSILGVSLLFSEAFCDMSWDGLWYRSAFPE